MDRTDRTHRAADTPLGEYAGDNDRIEFFERRFPDGIAWLVMKFTNRRADKVFYTPLGPAALTELRRVLEVFQDRRRAAHVDRPTSKPAGSYTPGVPRGGKVAP